MLSYRHAVLTPFKLLFPVLYSFLWATIIILLVSQMILELMIHSWMMWQLCLVSPNQNTGWNNKDLREEPVWFYSTVLGRRPRTPCYSNPGVSWQDRCRESVQVLSKFFPLSYCSRFFSVIAYWFTFYYFSPLGVKIWTSIVFFSKTLQWSEYFLLLWTPVYRQYLFTALQKE